MPKITFKNTFFRIFWKILAKTGPQSLYLCGFPEARGRNEGRPIQGIDTILIEKSRLMLFAVEMKVAPFRALTRFAAVLYFSRFRFVEMKVAPFRALPRPH